MPHLQLERRPSINITTRRITLRCTELQWVSYQLTGYGFTDNLLVLHPRHKLHYFKTARWEDNWIETAHIIIHTEFDQTYAFMDFDDKVLSMTQNKV